MPNMNRLTWGGLALHAGELPGYPASHGCVRLPMAFSERLWGLTHPGTPVIIAGAHSDPWELTHPGLVLGAYAEDEFEHAVAALDGKRHPSDWDAAAAQPVTTVIASTADRRVDLLENGSVIAEGRLSGPKGDARLGSHVFVLKGTHDGAKGLAWTAHQPPRACGRGAGRWHGSGGIDPRPPQVGRGLSARPDAAHAPWDGVGGHRHPPAPGPALRPGLRDHDLRLRPGRARPHGA